MKGIDKKACRAFLNPRRSLDLNNGLFYVEQIEYIVCTAIHIVGHRKLLILDFYPRAEAVKGMLSPHFTMFQATDDFITFDHGAGAKTRWRTAVLDNLERDYHFIFKCAFYSRQDEERVIRFCNASTFSQNMSGFAVLIQKQSELRDARSAAKRRGREQKIADRMKPLRPMGRSFSPTTFSTGISGPRNQFPDGAPPAGVLSKWLPPSIIYPACVHLAERASISNLWVGKSASGIAPAHK